MSGRMALSPDSFSSSALESVHRIGEGIGSGDHAQPGREALDGIDRAAGEEQQRVQDAEDGARHQRIFDAHHHQEHHGVEGDGCQQDQQQQAEQVGGMKIVPSPASRDPITVITMPASTALMAPATFSPKTSSIFVIGVTR